MGLVKKARKIPFIVVRAALAALSFKSSKFFPEGSIFTQQLLFLP